MLELSFLIPAFLPGFERETGYPTQSASREHCKYSFVSTAVVASKIKARLERDTKIRIHAPSSSKASQVLFGLITKKRQTERHVP